MTETAAGTPVRIVEGVSPERFRDEIVPGNEPVLLKGQVADWPAVRAAASADSAVRYLKGFDRGQPVETLVGQPEIGGHFFYNDRLDGLNFTRRPRSIGASMDRMLAWRGLDRPRSLYIESTPIRDHLPGFEQANRLGLLDASVAPRIWIGNRLTVQTHFDLKENVACVVAGRRRFTLFPPQQTPNLYPGPFELTLSGPPVSMVRLDAPDLERYPRFAEARRHAQVAELGPGDALYIPYFWWHHVQTRDEFNVLVNYWWNDADPELGSPFDAMLHALLSLRDLPPRQRDAWRTMLDLYVFGRYGDPLAHLPPAARGTLGVHDTQTRQQVRRILLGSLARQAGVRPPGDAALRPPGDDTA
jgi:hypothetical protein